MQSCRDVAYLIASEGLELANRFTRLMVRIHLLYCRHCRRHVAELEMMGQASRDTWNVAAVDRAAMRRLEGAIMDEAFGGPDEQHGDVSDDTHD